MAAIARGIDSFCTVFLARNDVSNNNNAFKHGQTASVFVVCGLLVTCALVLYTKFLEADFSAMLTLGSGAQCLGFLLLTLKVRAQQSAEGISSRMLQLYSLVLAARLVGTTFATGYIPLDAKDTNSDNFYQISDAISLLLVLQLLYCVHITHNKTYQAEKDTFEHTSLLLPCVALAVCIHANLNESAILDTAWYLSLNIDAIAMLPQIIMTTKIGGYVDSMLARFVVCLVASRACFLAFWFYGYAELTPAPNVAGKEIVAVYVIQLLLAADFLVYYLKGLVTGRMEIPAEDL